MKFLFFPSSHIDEGELKLLEREIDRRSASGSLAVAVEFPNNISWTTAFDLLSQRNKDYILRLFQVGSSGFKGWVSEFLTLLAKKKESGSVAKIYPFDRDTESNADDILFYETRESGLKQIEIVTATGLNKAEEFALEALSFYAETHEKREREMVKNLDAVLKGGEHDSVLVVVGSAHVKNLKKEMEGLGAECGVVHRLQPKTKYARMIGLIVAAQDAYKAYMRDGRDASAKKKVPMEITRYAVWVKSLGLNVETQNPFEIFEQQSNTYFDAIAGLRTRDEAASLFQKLDLEMVTGGILRDSSKRSATEGDGRVRNFA